ncbi:MAG: type II secretion system protein M [Marinicaulis sp.]|nr:type II secretion system protein M [Marinicaulis sp.]NNE40097.1 type II secretion system protein M [Marinicaulis sp.]NNL88416.1 type II secretion system protein M [Marinicaulis sp.]
MAEWYANLSEREKRMVSSLAVIAVAAFLFQVVLAPLNNWREDATQKEQQARDGLAMVVSAASTAPTQTAQGPRATTPLRTAITQSASAANIEILRIGAETNGQIEVQPGAVDSGVLFNWFGVLENKYGVSVAFADMSRGDAGGVNVQSVVFSRNSN